jgi:hydrogenase maturation protein HypF
MELEMAARAAPDKIYDYAWEDAVPKKIALAPIIRGVVNDLGAGIAPELISARFHATLVHLFSDLCEQLRRETGLKRVVLSGGVFQNEILLSGLHRALAQKRFEVYAHKLVPTNDGGISLGQAVAAAARMEK